MLFVYSPQHLSGCWDCLLYQIPGGFLLCSDKEIYTFHKALIALCNGASVTEVCKVLSVTRESIRLWRISLQKEGLQGLVKSKKKGKIPGLTGKVKKDLCEILNTEPKKFGYDHNKWTGKLICRYLKEKWDIDIAVRTAQNWRKLIQSS